MIRSNLIDTFGNIQELIPVVHYRFQGLMIVIATGFIPASRLIIATRFIHASRLIIATGFIPALRLIIATGFIPASRLMIAKGFIPASRLNPALMMIIWESSQQLWKNIMQSTHREVWTGALVTKRYN